MPDDTYLYSWASYENHNVNLAAHAWEWGPYASTGAYLNGAVVAGTPNWFYVGASCDDWDADATCEWTYANAYVALPGNRYHDTWLHIDDNGDLTVCTFGNPHPSQNCHQV